MFQKMIENTIIEIAHKKVMQPAVSFYFNHMHNHCEMLLFLRGEATYNIDGQTFTLTPYDLLFIPSATYHYLLPTEAAPYENYVIGMVPEIIPLPHYQKLFSPPLILNIKNDAVLLEFFTRLDLYQSRYSEEDFAMCAKAWITELITYCYYAKDNLASKSGDSIPLIDEIISFIDQNIESHLDADVIASHLLLSKSYVQNIFSGHMHIGLRQYIMQKKIFAAAIELSRGDSPNAVCEKYHFGDYTSFYRLYKKTFGTTPTADRARSK